MGHSKCSVAQPTRQLLGDETDQTCNTENTILIQHPDCAEHTRLCNMFATLYTSGEPQSSQKYEGEQVRLNIHSCIHDVEQSVFTQVGLKCKPDENFPI